MNRCLYSFWYNIALALPTDILASWFKQAILVWLLISYHIHSIDFVCGLFFSMQLGHTTNCNNTNRCLKRNLTCVLPSVCRMMNDVKFFKLQDKIHWSDHSNRKLFYLFFRLANNNVWNTVLKVYYKLSLDLKVDHRWKWNLLSCTKKTK